MTTEQQQVARWMEKAGQKAPETPTIPPLEVRKLRARLILEEALETINEGLGLVVVAGGVSGLNLGNVAIQGLEFREHPACCPDLTELADGMADLQVVNLGTAVACGIDLEPVFSEVIRSNDSKWWSVNEVDYLKQPGYSFRPVGDNLFCATDQGGKVIKSPSYSPANITPILEAQAGETK